MSSDLALFALLATTAGWRHGLLVIAAIAVIGAGVIVASLPVGEMTAKEKDGKTVAGQDRPWAFWLLFATGTALLVLTIITVAVRYIDVGDLLIESGRARTELPWIAIEYVHGGAEGTTLVNRVEHAIETTGYAFSPERAERAIQCLTSGQIGRAHV